MTENKAIEIVRKEKAYMDSHAGRAQSEAFQMAINALEKQVPKKPKTDDRYIIYICPCCNDFIKVNHNYCTNCGQRLDWESDEE